MAMVYVIQVMAHHGVGLEGWRTVRKPSGEAYSFQTQAAAQAALQQHFANLREGINVRVHAMAAEAALQALPGVSPTPPAGRVPQGSPAECDP